jgi:Mce-associated membrane protein
MSELTDTAGKTEAVEADEQAPAGGAGDGGGGGWRRAGVLGWLVPGLAGVLVVLLVLIAVFGYQTYNAARLDSARTEAVAAATAAAGDVLSYDYRHLDKDFAKAKRHLAPGFAKQYTKTTTTVVRPSALKIKAVVSAQVIKGSVVTATNDRVVTLLFVNQTTSSTLRSGKRTDLNRVRLTMERAGDKWLVARIQAL